MNYSFSAISAYQSCPRAFEYRYIKRLPEAFSSIELHLGRCVHETLQWVYQSRMDGNQPGEEEMVRHFDDVWTGSDLESAWIVKAGMKPENYHQAGLSMIQSFFRGRFLTDTSETLFIERRFELALQDGVTYTGVIDRVSRSPDGRVRIIDYKTGQCTGPLETLQLPSYAVHILDLLEVDLIEISFEDLKTHRTLVETFQSGDAPAIKRKLLGEIAVIAAAETFPTQPSRLCRWCGFHPVCDNPHPAVHEDPAFTAMNPNGSAAKEKTSDLYCPQCGAVLRERKGRFGLFMGCSNFPKCRYTLDSRGQPDGENAAAEICPECGSPLRERRGKYGTFLGCSAYPECRFTRALEKSN